MMNAYLEALSRATEPFTLLMLFTGVVLGLIIGVVPGIGGLFGLVMLVPFTYQMDSYSAFALLLGLSAVITTSDTIPAVLLGIPGSVGAIATVEDGHPLAKKNQAARALGASYSASLIGGLFGALVLGLSVPILRPLVLMMQTPDFLAVALTGMIFVCFISGSDPMKGIGALLLGVLLSFVGLDSHSGAERYTFGSTYLWDGVPLSILFLGLFALPELQALRLRRVIAAINPQDDVTTQWTGIRDTLREWKLVLQCSAAGALIGAMPGVGVTVVDWVAYGIAKRGGDRGVPFGEGNIRGVIAPESANNAKDGGYLIPTLALGLPGSATMTILLAAFTIHGLVPGPAMLNEHLPLTYSMVIFLALANIMGATICMTLTRPLAALTTVPSHRLLPVALVFVTMGALQTHGRLDDLLVLMIGGVLGMVMKARNWPRAAFSLGFVLGPSVERYFFLSYQLHGADMALRPSMIVAVLACLLIGGLWLRNSLRDAARQPAGQDSLTDLLLYLAFGALAVWAWAAMSEHEFVARLFPAGTALAMTLLALGLLLRLSLRWRAAPLAPGLRLRSGAAQLWDGLSEGSGMIGLLIAMAALIYLFGHLLAMVIFVPAMMMATTRRLDRTTVIATAITTGVIYVIFDRMVAVDWPDGLLF